MVAMKLQAVQIEKLSRRIFNRLKERELLVFKVSEADVLNRMIELMTEDFKKEDDLVHDVNKMLDQLEVQNPGIDRRKMFGLLKQKMAKDRKIVL
jgi:hypothetical protein